MLSYMVIRMKQRCVIQYIIAEKKSHTDIFSACEIIPRPDNVNKYLVSVSVKTVVTFLCNISYIIMQSDVVVFRKI